MPKISQLPTLSNLTSGSIIPVVENSTTQKISVGKLYEFLSGNLDQTFATEIELMRSASAITSSIETLSSSFDYRINAIIVGEASIPPGTISSSNQISVFGYAKTGSNTFNGSQTISNGNSLLVNRIENTTGGNIDIAASGLLRLSGDGGGVSTNDNFEANPGGANTFKVSSGSVSITGSIYVSGTPIISGATQISNLGFATTSSVVNVNTSSLLTTASFNTFSSSINQRVIDATNEQILNNLATTGSNSFSGSQTILAGNSLLVNRIENTTGGNIEIAASGLLSLSGDGGGVKTNDNFEANPGGNPTFKVSSGSVGITGSIYLDGGAAIISNYQDTVGSIDLKAGPGGWAELQSNNGAQYIWVDNDAAYIGTNYDSASRAWTFGRDGALNLATSTNGNGLIQIAGNIDLLATDKTYTFGNDGVLILPSGVGDIKRDGVSVLGGAGGGSVDTGSLVLTSSFNSFTASVNTFSSSFDQRIKDATNEQILDGFVVTSSFNSYTSSNNTKVNSLVNKTGSFATTGSNTFTDNQTILGFVTASSYLGNGRYLKNLPATTNWNYNQEYTIEKTEQLTFSGDYILEDTYLIVEGGTPNSIGEWDIRIGGHNGSISKTSDNVYTIEGPNSTGNASDGNFITAYFATASILSIEYVWNSRDAGNEWPTYEVTPGTNGYPYEIATPNVLVNPNSNGEFGTWTINVPNNSFLTIGIWSENSDNLTSTLEITLPYLFNSDIVQYSSNKYFKKEGKIFIGGNLLVKDSYIENNGLISVGGEVILIGNSQIDGTGTII